MLYKVIPSRYARGLIDDGEMMWSTLAWFQNLEEVERGDDGEGRYTYFPINGLEVHRIERAGLPDDTRFIQPGHGYVSRAAQVAHIFVYSLTLNSAIEIGDAADRSCVEIFDPPQFMCRVRQELSRRRRKAQVQTLIHRTVQYWAPTDPPEAEWALPHLLTTHKHHDFKHQKEYRFAFGIRSSIFDFENVDCFIVNTDTRWPRVHLDERAHRMKVRLGGLNDCCRII